MDEKLRVIKGALAKCLKPMRCNSLWRSVFLIGMALAILLSAFVYSQAAAPARFPISTIFTVEEGETLNEIAAGLKQGGYIRSISAFKFVTQVIFLKGNQALAGDYFFENKISVFSTAWRITNGEFHLEPIRITIPEGLTKFETADLLHQKLPDFDKNKFAALAPEGYLFPDTYFLMPNTKPERVVEIMTENFNRRIEALLPKVNESKHTLDDIIDMASIVETEARIFETRQIIAGILWKRIEEGMPLQVDVSFKYVNGKSTFELTTEDLDIDSPYNSYRYAGLPPTPISNPGLDSIEATLNPIETDYYYFLSDQNGLMHYAATFEQHKINRNLYLR